MSSKFTTARLITDGEHFEILVHPDNALNYKMGKNIEFSQVLAVEEVFSDSSKGLRVTSEKLQKYFKTANPSQAAKTILEKGDLQITSNQRRQLIDEKKKQIIDTIARNYIDPRTGLPHPPLRIEQALQEIRISIDPMKNGSDQAKLVIEKLRPILPLKSEKIKLIIKAPAQFGPQSIGVIKEQGTFLKEDWLSDGSLSAVVEIPGGAHRILIDRLGSISKGSIQVSVVK